MPEIVQIPLADLLLDTGNARLRDEQPNQQATLFALAKQQGPRLLKLAQDIVDFGTDPTALPIVLPTDDQRKRYVVREGNRRIAALKGLETPSLVSQAFSVADQKRLIALSKKFATKPIHSLTCILFESEQEADHWIRIRHTGQNEGVGLVEWGAEEKDRYNARHGQRSPAGQVMDYVQNLGTLSEAARNSSRDIITSLTRLLSTPKVREALGVDIRQGEMVQTLPDEYVRRALTKVIEELKTGSITVATIYTKDDRLILANRLTGELGRSKEQALACPVKLAEGTEAPAPAQGQKKNGRGKKQKQPGDRTALIPRTCQLNINPPRINSIYNELLGMSVDQYPNACSVLLRVFLELSVDHLIEQRKLLTEHERRNQNLAKRLKVAAKDLLDKSEINAQLHTAIGRIADSQFVLAASTVAFNQYVHNQYTFPKPTELRVAWDELQPFMLAVWPQIQP